MVNQLTVAMEVMRKDRFLVNQRYSNPKSFLDNATVRYYLESSDLGAIG